MIPYTSRLYVNGLLSLNIFDGTNVNTIAIRKVVEDLKYFFKKVRIIKVDTPLPDGPIANNDANNEVKNRGILYGHANYILGFLNTVGRNRLSIRPAEWNIVLQNTKDSDTS